MALSGKGWYSRYINLKRDKKRGPHNPLPPEEKFHEQSLYSIAQPSGIMYGHPVIPKYLDDKAYTKLHTEEKMKLVLLENLIYGASLRSGDLDKSDYEDFLNDFTSQMIEYYQSVFPETKIKTKSIWGKRRKNEELVEEIINERIYIKGGVLEDFWSKFFHNSLLFFDVYFFKDWMSNKSKVATVDELTEQRNKLRLMLLKLIAAAANADQIIQSEEKRLYNIFLKSAELPGDLEKEAKLYLEDKVTLQDIEFPLLKSWILRKYFLELAILTIWADKDVADEEREFLEELRLVLGFSKEDLETSFVAIESFVLENWKEVHFLQSKNNYQLVGQLFVSRLTNMAIKNKERITTEIRESKELMDLLTASTKRKLTPTEKEIVRMQLIDILKVLPTFVIIALPGTFITLPLLLKILPRSAFPSAFQE